MPNEVEVVSYIGKVLTLYLNAIGHHSGAK